MRKPKAAIAGVTQVSLFRGVCCLIEERPWGQQVPPVDRALGFTIG